MKCLISSLALAAAMSASSAIAQHQAFAVSPDSSEVKMTLKTNHEIVNGTFHVQTGTIDFDRSAQRIGGMVVIAAGSGKTGNDSRDKKMDKDILNIQQYSTVSFAPKSYTGILAPSGDSTVQVTGIFTLIGQPHELTVPMQVHIDGGNCGAKGHFVVPYVQWGMKNPSFLMWKADSTVDIDLNLVGHIS